MLFELLLLTKYRLPLAILAFLTAHFGKFVKVLKDIIPTIRFLQVNASLTIDVFFVGPCYGDFGSLAAASTHCSRILINHWHEGALLGFVNAGFFGHFFKSDLSLVRFADEKILILASDLLEPGLLAQLLAHQVIGSSRRAGVGRMQKDRLIPFERLCL